MCAARFLVPVKLGEHWWTLFYVFVVIFTFILDSHGILLYLCIPGKPIIYRTSLLPLLFFFLILQSHSLLLIVQLALSWRVNKRGVCFESVSELHNFLFAFTYSKAALFHGHSRELQQRVCDPYHFFFLKFFPSSRTLLPLLYRSCCIFHIGCWVAIHCPIVLTFFLFLQFLRFRCKKEVDTARSDACFSVVDFPHFLFHSLHIQTCGGSRCQVDLSSKLKKNSREGLHIRGLLWHIMLW